MGMNESNELKEIIFMVNKETTEGAALLNKIKAEGKVSDDIAEQLKSAVGEFIDTYK